MPDPLLPLHDAYTAACNDLIAFEARVTTERADLTAKVATARQALASQMPEGVPFATAEGHPPVVMRRGDEVLTVVPHFLGHPYPPDA